MFNRLCHFLGGGCHSSVLELTSHLLDTQLGSVLSELIVFKALNLHLLQVSTWGLGESRIQGNGDGALSVPSTRAGSLRL